MKKIKILGMDPSFRNWGWALAEFEYPDVTILDIGTLETQRNKKAPKRSLDDLESSRFLYSGLHSLLDGVDLVIAEMPSGSQSALAAKAYGVTVGLMSSIGIPLITVSPLEIKQLSTGTANATKEEMIEWAFSKYPNLSWKTKKRNGKESLVKKNEHMADAIAAIHAGTYSKEFIEYVENFFNQ